MAAVIHLAHGVGVGHLCRVDDVAAADFGRVQAELDGGGVEQAFDQVDRLWAAGAAIGGGGGGVGEYRVQHQVDVADVIDAGGDPGTDQQLDDDAGGARIGAHVAQRAHPVAEHLAVGVQRQFGVAFDVAAVGGGEEFVDAGGGPFHRALQKLGRVGGYDVLRVQPGLHAETAADIVDDDADFFLFHAEHAGQRVAGARRHLAGQAHGDAAGIEGAERAARLHRRGGQALVDDVDSDGVGGAGEGGVRGGGVAVLHLGGDVAGGFGPNLRGVRGDGGGQGGNDGQVIVVDFDRLQRVLGLFQRVGDHGGDGLADEANGVDGQGRAQRGGAGRAVRALEDRRQRQRLHASGDQIRARQHDVNARHRHGGRGVDRDDTGVGPIRAEECQMGLAGERNVVREVPRAG